MTQEEYKTMTQHGCSSAQNYTEILAEHISVLEQEVERLKQPKYGSGYLRAKFG